MADSEEEDDYLSMTFAEDPKSSKESSLQRQARLRREAAERGKVPSKQELAEREQHAREEALATKLDSSNKGAKMMAKMGFKGGALGKSEGARTEPIAIEVKDDRGGIGMDSEKKRKVREAAEAAGVEQKRVKVSEDDFRARNRQEREEKRAEGMWWAAMKILEGIEDSENQQKDASDVSANSGTEKRPSTFTTTIYNILYRPLVKNRLEKDRDRRRTREMEELLSRDKQGDDDSEAEQVDVLPLERYVEDIDEEDPELEEYENLTSSDRLAKVVGYLRETHHYCFWCKFTYPDSRMEGCPGLTEDEHG